MSLYTAIYTAIYGGAMVVVVGHIISPSGETLAICIADGNVTEVPIRLLHEAEMSMLPLDARRRIQGHQEDHASARGIEPPKPPYNKP